MSKLPYGKTPTGMTDAQYHAFCDACDEATICPPKFPARPRIVQAIGDAKASAGFHHQDGVQDGRPYCAAIDVSVKSFQVHGMNTARLQIKWFLYHMALHGWAGWYRFTGSFAHNQHIHAVWAGLPMKPALENQIIDFVHDRTGLVGHAKEEFWTAPKEADDAILALFRKSNPGAFARV